LKKEMVRPRSSEIDKIIFWVLLKKQAKKKLVTKHGIPVDIDIVTMSYTELYEMVATERKARSKKGLSHETFRDRLKRLVLLHILRKYPKAKGKGEVYGFDKEAYLKIEHDTVKLLPEELARRRFKIKHGLT
jgi:hypothetical protein